jgi:hypothetical protein
VLGSTLRIESVPVPPGLAEDLEAVAVLCEAGPRGRRRRGSQIRTAESLGVESEALDSFGVPLTAIVAARSSASRLCGRSTASVRTLRAQTAINCPRRYRRCTFAQGKRRVRHRGPRRWQRRHRPAPRARLRLLHRSGRYHRGPGRYRLCITESDCTPVTVPPSPARQMFDVSDPE